ncbi:MAG: hypothetical protein LBK76_11030 [Verrucomicrobiales bacterium]|jgi:hypothetical protein|nr:hypothetical protein [Verrucomicrobiales bacterium]
MNGENRGGKRKGAGRKPKDKAHQSVTFTISLTKTEYQELLGYIAQTNCSRGKIFMQMYRYYKNDFPKFPVIISPSSPTR